MNAGFHHARITITCLHICNSVRYRGGMTERDKRIPDLVSKAEAAEILGVKHQAVQQMVDKGRLKGAKIGSTWVFSRAAVLALKREPAEEPAVVQVKAQMAEVRETLARADAVLSEHQA